MQFGHSPVWVDLHISTTQNAREDYKSSTIITTNPSAGLFHSQAINGNLYFCIVRSLYNSVSYFPGEIVYFNDHFPISIIEK